MKKLILLPIALFLMVSNALAYTIIQDPNVFYSMYENPATTIDFTMLKDGTTYSDPPADLTPDTSYISYPNRLIIYTGDRDGSTFTYMMVRSNTFSDNWEFKNYDVIFQERVIWYDGYISN